MKKIIPIILTLTGIYGCAEMLPQAMEPSAGHIPVAAERPQTNIPEIVQETAVLPEPEPVVEEAKYTVVVI